MKRIGVVLALFVVVTTYAQTRFLEGGFTSGSRKGGTQYLIYRAPATQGPYAHTKFVSATGNDSYSGRMPDSAWQTIGKVNGYTWAAGDTVLFKAGDTFSDVYLTIDQSGAKNNPIVFGKYGTGANPLFDMRTQVQGWVARGTIWKKYWPDSAPTHQVWQTFYNDVRGSRQTSVANVNGTTKWCWTGDTLYTYDTTSTIKVPYQVRGILSDAEDFIEIDSIDVYGAIHNGIGVETSGAHSWTITGCRVKYNSMGIYFAGDTVSITGCRTDHNGYYSQEHGIYIPGNNFTVSQCQSDSNAGAGIHQWTGGSGTITRNKAFNNGTAGDDGWGIVVWECDAGSTVNISYNLVYDNSNYGIVIAWSYGTSKFRVYNNTVSGTPSAEGWFAGMQFSSNAATDSFWIKNNISYENGHGELGVAGDGVYAVDYNDYYRADAGTMISFTGNNYTRSQFATYQAAKSQDAHGINTDPTFVSYASRNLRIQTGSPCKDTGTSVGLSIDYYGTAVPYNSVVDMGSHEYTP